jgi:hypothetical protein
MRRIDALLTGLLLHPRCQADEHQHVELNSGGGTSHCPGELAIHRRQSDG